LFGYEMLVIVLRRDFVFFLTPNCYGNELVSQRSSLARLRNAVFITTNKVRKI